MIYFATIAAHVMAGEYIYLAFALLHLACGAVLFAAEAFEISFTLLYPVRDQTEPDIRASLDQLHPEAVLADRQVAVAATITTLTASLAFPWILVPFWGRVASPVALAWYTLVLSASTVLWILQVGPKRLAARSPARLWRATRWLLRPIALAGKLGISEPAGDIVRLWEFLFPLRENMPMYELPSLQVASLWAPCNCAVCNPRAYAARSQADTAVA